MVRYRREPKEAKIKTDATFICRISATPHAIAQNTATRREAFRLHRFALRLVETLQAVYQPIRIATTSMAEEFLVSFIGRRSLLTMLCAIFLLLRATIDARTPLFAVAAMRRH